MKKTTSARRYRRELLASVSAFALVASIYSANAADDDADRPILWIGGGWHFEKVSGLGDPFVPPDAALAEQAGFTSAAKAEKLLDYSYGADGEISFQPEKSDWIFSASFRYGRAHGGKHVHEEKTIPESKARLYEPGNGTGTATFTMPNNYNELGASNRETHVVVDFGAGKDVGLGLFNNGSSNVNFGVRFAQFKSELDVKVYARPDGHFVILPNDFIGQVKYLPHGYYHKSALTGRRQSDFTGIGPSISWNNSTPLAGNAADGEIALDWGLNAGVLFGRQRTKVHHKSTAEDHHAYKQYKYNSPKYYQKNATSVVHGTGDHTRNRSVIVPNLGGFAGLSLDWSNAKVSLGYRADIFFNALDTGIDVRHETTRSFMGPYASISVGVGD